ncbi:MAG: diguanylate cyclase [Spirochaetes bacterium]|nr:diguanylate cyclase [Spirochaetota bacterium]
MERDLSILIVDDDRTVNSTIEKILKVSNPGYFIQSAYCVESAIQLSRETFWDTILLDLSLPLHEGGTPDPQYGLRALETLKGELNITTPVIAITGYADDELSDIVLDKGAYYFLNKPLKPKSLAAIVKNSTRFQLSGFDGLTGLLNRKTFDERLRSEFERVKRKNQIQDGDSSGPLPGEVQSYLSLIFIDCDNFKLINDNFSHLDGDRVLKSISISFIDETIYNFKDLKSANGRFIIRPYDIASRFGGDEFSIYLPETNHENALTVARRIRSIMDEMKVSLIVGHPSSDANVDHISLSIGVATYPFPNFVKDHSDLLTLADQAMYASKEHRTGEIFGFSDRGEMTRFD